MGCLSPRGSKIYFCCSELNNPLFSNTLSVPVYLSSLFFLLHPPPHCPAPPSSSLTFALDIASALPHTPSSSYSLRYFRLTAVRQERQCCALFTLDPHAWFYPPFLYPSLFPLFLQYLYQSFSCFIPQYLPNDSYLLPSPLPFLLLFLSHYLSPYLPLFHPPLFLSPSLSPQTLSVSRSHINSCHPDQARAEDVYFMLLS